jgi:hypothetical protein
MIFSSGVGVYSLGACARVSPADEAAARADRSNTLLHAHGVGISPTLPKLEAARATRLRPADEIILRAACLYAVAVAASGNAVKPGDEFVELWNARASLTPNERKFLQASPFSDAAREEFSWKIEAAYPLLWALGWVEAPIWPSYTVDPKWLDPIFQAGPGHYAVELASTDAVLDQADLVYRMHWALDEARSGRPAKTGDLNPGVVAERHRAMNWLIRYDDADWDNVATDT